MLFFWLSGVVLAADAPLVKFGWVTQAIQPWNESGFVSGRLSLAAGPIISGWISDHWRWGGEVLFFKDQNTIRPMASAGPIFLLGKKMTLGTVALVRSDSHLKEIEAWGGSIVPGIRLGNINVMLPCGRVRIEATDTWVSTVSLRLVFWF